MEAWSVKLLVFDTRSGPGFDPLFQCNFRKLSAKFFSINSMLMGIIINNAIVLIDQIDIERKTAALREAIVTASCKRVTPITLTSLTTILGLLPMALSGGAMFEPMATLMIGGLLLSSIMSLFFVPSAYYLFFRKEG